MKSIRMATLIVVLLASWPASAATISLRAASCQDFTAQTKGDLSYTLAFLDGYYRTEDDPLVIDQDKSGASAKQLAEYCVANPNENLIEAADKIYKKE